ncbi:hypothetical protein [Mycolicibacterium arenosum]|uniref:Mercury transporter n=1 Tax=Mycolicibacterium arenosum TaxID=2952157 RepID=A0ABT1MDR6_9MYCO|nr:hypothetical protein [Mycolicibacterium sp. CAU 1645]MCP9276329.1 hypothetical protein [Mycolicibacterium sp. CAU 1645]
MAAAKRVSGKRWWASIGVGAAACVACCTVVPMFIAGGLVGSGVLLAGAKWFEPVGFALIAIGIVGLAVTWIRNRRRGSAGWPDECGTGCGCAPTESVAPSSDLVS